MKFTLELDSRAIQDIQEAIDYYDEQLIGLGEKFESYLNKYIKTLAKNPFYQIRYDNIRCLPMKKYPFMIHFTVDEQINTVYIHSIINTSRDPKGYWVK
ncbi:MAG: hypothetical protein HYU67_06680 [Flavobacteriia bacterium]|nr:hypothetical protein [Flavobacteriia bacterium]